MLVKNTDRRGRGSVCAADCPGFISPKFLERSGKTAISNMTTLGILMSNINIKKIPWVVAPNGSCFNKGFCFVLNGWRGK